jgi:hypothetical protein
MKALTYTVFRDGSFWRVRREDGSIEGEYSTKESAFEAYVLASSNAIKDGCGVSISAPVREPGEPALGAF